VTIKLPKLTKVAIVAVAFSTVLTMIVTADEFCGYGSFGPHNPYSMSYGMLWNYIQEYENPKLPEHLRPSLRGYEISVGVWFSEQGVATGCGGQVIVRKPYQKGITISQHLEQTITALLCPSIKTWKFRPLTYCSKAVPVTGPIVFRVVGQKFALIEVTDPRFRKGPPPMERKEN